MTTYAIGNVHGNITILLKLLEKIQFRKERDTLWFSGNLVNSGPDSLAVLRFVKDLENRAVTVLGQQELHLLAVAEGVQSQDAEDTFNKILAAPDCNALLKWLRQCPFLHNETNFTLVNAGIPAEWSLSQAQTFAMEAETSLSMGNHKAFLENIFADDPTRWHAKHRGWKRVRFIVNAFTRMRYCTESGRLDFHVEGLHGAAPEGYIPWYLMANRAMANQNILFGNGSKLDNDEVVSGIFPLKSAFDSDDSLSAWKVSSQPEKIRITLE